TVAAPEAPPPPPEPETRILERLPLGIVVFRGDQVLFANRAFLDMLGYESLAGFAKAGGRDTLFPEGGPDLAETNPAETRSQVSVRREDNSRLAVDARLQSVAWGDQSAMLLSLREYSP